MSQQYASGGQLPEEADAVLTDGDDASSHSDSSSRLEQFGLGVSLSILLGAVLGVAAAASLNAGALPLFVALGLGFIFSPVIGLLFLQRFESKQE
ncbi:hypothetical protein DVK02_06370 [Halobellus sp. Atlit-31R]|nr:hypothetical protein DVK02_06370 [Halobellus sp. Atlit-31R]